MGFVNQKTRILSVYEILKRKSDEDHPITANYIIEELSSLGVLCERKTIYADIEALNLFGIEVIHTDFPSKGYFLSDRSFEISEISLLIDAVLSADFITPKKTTSLISKLRSYLSVYQENDSAKNTFVYNRNKCDNEEIYYSIDTIQKAIHNRKKLSLSYFKYVLKSGHFIEKETKTMRVSPYALIWEDDHYYLVCNNEKYDNLMHLRLDKIKKAEELLDSARPFSEVSEYRDEFNTSDYVQKTFNMFSGEPEEITLKCNIKILNQIIDKFGNDIFVRSSDDTHLLFDSKVNISEGFEKWLLSFGEDVEVIKPQYLRDKIVKAIKAIEEKYK